MYATQAKIAKDSWTKELLSLLEDEPYRVVTHHELAQMGDYDEVCDCIQRSYAPLVKSAHKGAESRGVINGVLWRTERHGR